MGPSLEGFTGLGTGQLVSSAPARVRLRAGAVTVEVTALAPDLFRVGMFGDGRPPNYASEGVAKAEWASHPTDQAATIGEIPLSTAAATAHIALDPLRLRFSDRAGRSFAEDDPALGMGFLAASGSPSAWPSVPASGVRVYKRRPSGERYFGCGERTGPLEKTDSHQLFWNIDPPVGHTPASNNLYTSIPFLLALHQGRAWGLFVDNCGRVEFDLAREVPDRTWFESARGDLIYYVFAGPTPRAVVDRYTELTGRIPMPPLWALGNQQSRYSYMSAEEVLAVAHQFRQRGIPCDVLYIDIDYMDGYRVFTWDRDRFPEPETLTARLREEGFHLVAIVDPGVKVDQTYRVYLDGRQQDLFCKTATGEEFQNVVWPGRCAFPDFTNPKARAWWGAQHAALLDAGVAGIWCDMNEPALFLPAQSTMPGDVVHQGGGQARQHAEIHNAYGSLMARATREGLQALRPAHRPFVISRSGYAGLQRYALQWSGDNSSWWEHLAMSMPQLQNMGLSGMAWAGVDVGGFWGDASGELLARWTEFGAFQPFCRNHSAKGTRRQEPWAFGEPYESLIRGMLQLRQRLVPYLYTLFEASHRTGAPILRPLLFEYPEDEATYTADDEFLVGEALLVAPMTRPGAEHRHVYLPQGTWFHWWSGKSISGPVHILAHAPLGKPALYVKANIPIPLWPVMNFVGERSADPLTFVVFPAEGKGAFALYEDAGDGTEYRQEMFSRREVSCDVAGTRVAVGFGERRGRFLPERAGVELELRGFDAPPQSVVVSGRDAPWRRVGGAVVVSLSEQAAPFVVELRR